MGSSEELYCTCRTSYGGGFMIQCEHCDVWFHGKCVKIKRKESINIDKYYCKSCIQKNPNLKIVYTESYVPPPEKKIKKEDTKSDDRVKTQDPNLIESSDNNSILAKEKIPAKPVRQVKINQHRKKPRGRTKGLSKIQCRNPECMYEARTDSAYCSDECGFQLNRARYEKFFIPNWKPLEGGIHGGELRRQEILNQIQKEKEDLEALITKLKHESVELKRTIEIIKSQAKEQRASMKNDIESNDDENSDNDECEETLTGDQAKTYCVTCGISLIRDKAFGHWSSCHKKHESYYNYTADVKITFPNQGGDNNDLYCHHQDKKSKRYCMYLAAACPQHSNWHSDKGEVCGCPEILTQKLEISRKYCVELKKDCTLHYHWDKFRLAEVNLHRVQALTRLDAISERHRNLEAALMDRFGGVVGVMLHKTTDYNTNDTDKPET